MRRMQPAATHSHETRADSGAGALAADRLAGRRARDRDFLAADSLPRDEPMYDRSASARFGRQRRGPYRHRTYALNHLVEPQQ